VPYVPHIDADFLALPARSLADAALQRARDLGVEHADFRVERVRAQRLVLADAAVESGTETDQLGLAVRVVKDGTWGFAASSTLSTSQAAATAVATEITRLENKLHGLDLSDPSL
jgi:TldD protein